MGMALEFHEKQGPVMGEPIRTRGQFDKLRDPDPDDDLSYVMETIRILRRELKVPLIGFSGAPFTLLTYMIEGGSSKNFLHTKRMMYQSPTLYADLMDKVSSAVTSYIVAQARAGAQALQLFDTWAGILCPEDFRLFVLPYVKKIVATAKKENVPVIYFVNGSAGILKLVKQAGADVVGVDWRIEIADAIKAVGKRYAVQGNLDPVALFMSHKDIASRARDIVSKGRAAKGHIFNLGHGILPETPVDGVKALVDAVHEASVR
jgi:uroporphyrinogen decarboxylase